MKHVVRGSLILLTALSAVAFAQQGGLQPGEYLDGGGGVLVIKGGTATGLPFDLQTVGANRHSCSVQGSIGKNGQAVVKEDGETCTIGFAAKPDGVDVQVKGECHRFCGARATLDGMFYKPPAGCERAAVRKTRTQFKQLYDKKAYADARAALEPIITKCQKTLDLDSDGRIRNDLAITQYHLGDSAGCRKTLEPLAEEAGKTDAKLREDYPPSDAEMFIAVARMTRTNLKLCQSSKKP